MKLPPLPEPDTHCFDDDTRRDVWSYSERRMRAYAEQAVAAERERCAKLCEAENRLGLDDERAYNGMLMAAAIRGQA